MPSERPDIHIRHGEYHHSSSHREPEDDLPHEPEPRLVGYPLESQGSHDTGGGGQHHVGDAVPELEGDDHQLLRQPKDVTDGGHDGDGGGGLAGAGDDKAVHQRLEQEHEYCSDPLGHPQENGAGGINDGVDDQAVGEHQTDGPGKAHDEGSHQHPSRALDEQFGHLVEGVPGDKAGDQAHDEEDSGDLGHAVAAVEGPVDDGGKARQQDEQHRYLVAGEFLHLRRLLLFLPGSHLHLVAVAFGEILLDHLGVAVEEEGDHQIDHQVHDHPVLQAGEGGQADDALGGAGREGIELPGGEAHIHPQNDDGDAHDGVKAQRPGEYHPQRGEGDVDLRKAHDAPHDRKDQGGHWDHDDALIPELVGRLGQEGGEGAGVVDDLKGAADDQHHEHHVASGLHAGTHRFEHPHDAHRVLVHILEGAGLDDLAAGVGVRHPLELPRRDDPGEDHRKQDEGAEDDDGMGKFPLPFDQWALWILFHTSYLSSITQCCQKGCEQLGAFRDGTDTHPLLHGMDVLHIGPQGVHCGDAEGGEPTGVGRAGRRLPGQRHPQLPPGLLHQAVGPEVLFVLLHRGEQQFRLCRHPAPGGGGPCLHPGQQPFHLLEVRLTGKGEENIPLRPVGDDVPVAAGAEPPGVKEDALFRVVVLRQHGHQPGQLQGGVGPAPVVQPCVGGFALHLQADGGAALPLGHQAVLPPPRFKDKGVFRPRRLPAVDLPGGGGAGLLVAAVDHDDLLLGQQPGFPGHPHPVGGNGEAPLTVRHPQSPGPVPLHPEGMSGGVTGVEHRVQMGIENDLPGGAFRLDAGHHMAAVGAFLQGDLGRQGGKFLLHQFHHPAVPLPVAGATVDGGKLSQQFQLPGGVFFRPRPDGRQLFRGQAGIHDASLLLCKKTKKFLSFLPDFIIQLQFPL